MCALDADDLEGWLKTCPAAHTWISERLGLRPQGVETLDAWWDRFSAATSPNLPSSLFLAGRSEQAQRLRQRLAAEPQLTLIRSEWDRDIQAFVYASTHEEEGRAILAIDEPEVWNRVVQQLGQAVLIPRFDNADVTRALQRGHHVIGLVDRSTAVVRNPDIALPRLDRAAAADALHDSGITFIEADQMAVLARRSLPAMVRAFSINPSYRRPEWSVGPQAALLAPLVLVGSWTTSGADIGMVERLTGQPWSAIEPVCVSLAEIPNAVLRRVDDTWTFASPEEAFRLLHPQRGATALKAWRSEASAALLADDGPSGLAAWLPIDAQKAGREDLCSATLRHGLAQGLALMGAMGADAAPIGGRTLPEMAADVVHEMLRAANDEPTGAIWHTLRAHLPLLAEAAPYKMLDALDDALEADESPLAALFRDQSTLAWGVTPGYTELLWALERIAWSEQHLLGAVRILARLAKLDSGTGNWVSRPSHSLATILCGWSRHTSAPLPVRLQALDAVLRESDTVGWKLLLDLWPQTSGWTSPPAAPTVRDDWRPAVASMPMTEWATFSHRLVELAIDRAGTDGQRLQALTEGLHTVLESDRERILTHLSDLAREGSLDESTRANLWTALRDLAARHERFESSAWAMPPDSLERVKAVAALIEPEDGLQRFAHLFDWHPNLAGGESQDPGTRRAKLAALRREVMTSAIALPRWESQVADLATRVKAPSEVGVALAAVAGDLDVTTTLTWLMADSDPVQTMAESYMRHRLYDPDGTDYLLSLLATPSLQGELRRRILALVPARPEFWRALGSSADPADLDIYWENASMTAVDAPDLAEALDALMKHGRSWTAIAVAALSLEDAPEPAGSTQHEGQEVDVVGVLTAALHQEPREGELNSMTAYCLGLLLDRLEATGAPLAQIAAFELGFYPVLKHQRTPVALHQVLATEPDHFVEFVTLAYRGRDEPSRRRTAQHEASAERAWWALQGWKGCPGLRQDGTVDTGLMKTWVDAARLELSDRDRADIGDELIGQTFTHAPAGGDGLWPPEPVRELLETLGSKDLENGLVIGRLNSRGVTMRGIYDGGAQERTLAEKYRDAGRIMEAEWPRTARALRKIAEWYEHQARREDRQAELDGDRR